MGLDRRQLAAATSADRQELGGRTNCIDRCPSSAGRFDFTAAVAPARGGILADFIACSLSSIVSVVVIAG